MNFSNEIPDSLKQRRAFRDEDARAILDRALSVRAISPFKFLYDNIRLGYRDKLTKATFVYGTNEQYLVTHTATTSATAASSSPQEEERTRTWRARHDTREGAVRRRRRHRRVVRLNGVPFTVIGEFEKKGKFLGNNFDEVACIPATVMDSTVRAKKTRRRGS